MFELGHIYLQLVQTLGLRLPLVDPSHYISRYAGLLEFGDETHKVATDAVRLVQRFDRDWMTRGRRPAGICGAALILAARMNNFRRSIEEIVQVVKIADTTVKKRLDEFKMTPSANLTLADFRSVMLEEEMDPPAFTKGKEKDLELDGSDEESSKKGKRKKKSRKGKRKRVESDEDNEIAASVVPTDEEAAAHDRIPIDPALLNEGILASTSSDAPVVDSSLPEQSTLPVSQPEFINAAGPSSLPASTLPSEDPVESTFSSLLAEEVSTVLQNDTRASQVHSALDEAEERRLAEFAAGDDLTGLDEDELDAFLLTEEEVKIKERVWVELNKDYLEALAGTVPYNKTCNNLSFCSSVCCSERRSLGSPKTFIQEPQGSNLPKATFRSRDSDFCHMFSEAEKQQESSRCVNPSGCHCCRISTQHDADEPHKI